MKRTAEEMKNFAWGEKGITSLRDVMHPFNVSVPTINKDDLKDQLRNIGGNERNLRNTARYLYYRSNVLYRIVNWYADMWDLRCRKVTPKIDLTKDPDPKKLLKQFNDTLTWLDIMDMQGSITEVLINVYIQDVCYALTFLDDTGMFFYILDPDECIIDSRYQTKDFGFAIDMSKWRSSQKQKLIEYIGSPLKEMYEEYRRTNQRWIHCPDEYAACFKFRTDRWDLIVPPFAPVFLQLAALEDLVDIQAEADALSVYKLIYLPMKVLSGSKDSDNFEVDPELSIKYFQKMLDNGSIPEGVGSGVIPGEELKYIDFSKSVDSDTNSVEKASNQILQTAGGGAVINSNNITSTAAFKAWLKSETEFAISTLMPQINGFVNRMLSYKLSNPCHVDHFEVSVYNKEDLAEQLLKSCQYSYSYRLAYGTLLGISEKETMAMLMMENDILKLQDVMKYPLSSSFTQSDNGYTSEVGQGAPKKDDDEIGESGERMRNQ